MIKLILLISCLGLFASIVNSQDQFEKDTFSTSAGALEITFIGHGTLMFNIDGKMIHVDPWTKLADYSTLPQADIILITHEHRDHLDPEALNIIRTDETEMVYSESCTSKVSGGIIVKNGDTLAIQGIKIEAVPAYNIEHKRDTGVPFHPEGVGNGYILTIGDKRIYVAGDTENTPEMKALEDIDIAFLPMNLPYTMTPEMVADAAKAFKPKVLYPYHYGETDTNELIELMKDTQGIEVRIRQMQ
ncbi:MBL fold metallo-hydrolase [bacterium]|nr:MBL fold metallo-hydrolase [bacterium]